MPIDIGAGSGFEAVQILYDILLIAGKVALVALGFNLLYSTTRFFHIAHGVVYVFGAYAAFAVVERLRDVYAAGAARSVAHFPWWGMALAGVCAIAVAAALGGLMELCIFRPLRKRGATPLVLLIASLGLYIVLQNVISAVCGDDTKSIRTWPVREGLNVLGARITPAQIVIIGAAVVLFLLTALVLRRTRAGIAMRALASNSELATVSGMDTDRVVLLTFVISSALAGAAAVLVSLDVDMTPTMGLNALLMGGVAAIIGGIGSLPGAALGALLLATAQQVGVIWLPSQWQDAIAFGILLLFLVFRPQGMFGTKIRKVTI